MRTDRVSMPCCSKKPLSGESAGPVSFAMPNRSDSSNARGPNASTNDACPAMAVSVREG